MLKIIFSISIFTLLHIHITYSMEATKKSKLSTLLEEKNDLYSVIEHSHFTLPQPKPVVYSEYPVDSIKTNNEHKKKRSSKQTQKKPFPKKRKKKPNITYYIPCPVEGCSKTSFVSGRTHNIIEQILMHQYSQEHNPNIYKDLQPYCTENTVYNELTSKYETPCYYCKKKLICKKKSRIAVHMIRHIYTTKLHNPQEYNKAVLVVKNYLKKAATVN